MKFYKYNNYHYAHYYHDKIITNKLDCVYYHVKDFCFFKNGKQHNSKNAAYICDKYKEFYLNGTSYGNKDNFTKESWRKFVKMKVFL